MVRDAFDAYQVLRSEMNVDRAELLVDLLGTLRADESRGHTRLGERPGDRELEQRCSLVAGDLGQAVGLRDVPRECLALEAIEAATLVVRRELVARTVPSGEQPFAERAVHDHADAVAGAVGDDVARRLRIQDVES